MARIIQFQPISQQALLVLDDTGRLWVREIAAGRGAIWRLMELPEELDPDFEEGPEYEEDDDA